MMLTAYNSVEIADKINEAFAANKEIKVNGWTMKSRNGRTVASSWQNGSVSIVVPAKAKGKTRDVFYKVGAAIVITDH